jgi:hypothetical protein
MKKNDTLKNCDSQYCTALNGRVMVNNKLCKIVIVASCSVMTAFFEVTKEKHENLSENNMSHRSDSNQGTSCIENSHNCLIKLAVLQDIYIYIKPNTMANALTAVRCFLPKVKRGEQPCNLKPFVVKVALCCEEDILSQIQVCTVFAQI